MTTLLTITARPDAPVACDMTTAEDTLPERLGEYRRLFDHALLGRESTDTTTTFRFAARPGVREWVLDLVRREAACCPFLSYEVDSDGDDLVWTVTGVGEIEMAVLEEFLTGEDHSGTSSATSSSDIAQQLTARAGVPVIVPGDTLGP